MAPTVDGGYRVVVPVSDDNTYARLYHRFRVEFPDVYGNDAQLAAWVRLLMLADASWPSRPFMPRSVKSRPLAALVGVGLVILDGDSYTVLGLDAERTRRRNAGRAGAAARWHSDGNANASAIAMPSRAEQSKSKESPPPPAKRGRRSDGTNPRADGRSPRQAGSAPRDIGSSPRQVRESQKRGPTRLHEILAAAAEGRTA